MSNMTILMNRPGLQTELEIWSPKYSSALEEEGGEWIVKLSKRKVDFGTAVIRINFTKAKHLKGLKFAMYRKDVIKCPLGTNGTIPVYEVPMSALCYWQSTQEIRDTANKLFPSSNDESIKKA